MTLIVGECFCGVPERDRSVRVGVDTYLVNTDVFPFSRLTLLPEVLLGQNKLLLIYITREKNTKRLILKKKRDQIK